MRKMAGRNKRRRTAECIGVCFEPLEPRLLLSGSWAAGVDNPSPDPQPNNQDGFTQESGVLFESTGISGVDALQQKQSQPQTGTIVDILASAPAIEEFAAADPAPEAAISEGQTPPAPSGTPTASVDDVSGSASDSVPKRELVFVNENVADYEQLIADLQGKDESRTIEVVVLESHRNGIEQVSEILSDRSGLSAVHFITHGADGMISLGGSWLTNANLPQHSESIAKWGEALSESGDILFYGCNIAADEDGQSLLKNLSVITGADVAASKDVTGPGGRGGDWDLEYKIGSVDASGPVSGTSLQDWDHLLATYVVTNTNNSGAGSLRQAITDANNNAGADTITFNIAGTGTHTIAPTTALPTITEQVTIDATTDDSFAANGNRPAIVLDGNDLADHGVVLSAGSGGSTVRGLVIRNFGRDGLNIETGSDNNIIQGNYLGAFTTDGTNAGAAFQNAQRGISVSGANNLIGGTAPGEGNLVGGNLQSGIRLDGASATGNVVSGNLIGVAVDGTTSVSNGAAGVVIDNGASGNRIGGTSAAESNLIAYNGGDGIRVINASTLANAFLGNRLFANTDDGIDLGNNGLTANDAGDADAGANNLQNFPVLTSANSNAAGTTIAGTLNSNANTTYRIEFFANRPTVADSPNGEGERYLGFVTVTTDGSGNATISTTLANVWVNSGDRITASATVDLGGGNYGSTSEFAANVTATSTGIIVVDTTSDAYDSGVASGSVTISTLGGSRGTDGRISLREAMFAANNTANGGTPDKIVFAIPTNSAGYSGARGVFTISAGTALPTVSQALTIDGTSQATNVGDTNAGFLGAGGTVGVDGLTLSQVARPEIELRDGAAVARGIDINAASVTVRGLAIYGFTDNIYVENVSGALIEGNVLGTAADSFTDPGAGVRTDNYGVHVVNGDGGILRNNLIGYSALGGARIESGADSWLVENNEFRGNSQTNTLYDGVAIEGTAATVRGNLVINNLGNAIEFFNAGSGHTVVNNTVTGNAGSQGWAIAVADGIGSTTLDRNRIVSNTGVAIAILGGGTGNRITANSISGNTSLGIDLGMNGVTLNDAGDPDTGNNNLQNFPVLTSARSNGVNQLTLTGTLNSTANTQFRIEFFASTTQDGSGYGEGQRYLGFANVTTDGSGNATISTTLTATVAVGEFISATTTKSNAGFTAWTDTSEFGRSVSAVSSTQATITVDTTSDTSDGDTTSLSTLMASKGADGFISLREAIIAANNTANGASPDRIVFNIAGSGPHVINVASALPTINQAVIIDGSSEPDYTSNVPVVRIDGASAGAGVNGITIGATGGGSTIRGLIITRFGGDGINVASGANGVTIAGNWIGTTGTGSSGVGNADDGLDIYGSNAIIGGTGANDRNVITNSGDEGIDLKGSGVTGHLIQGNYVGVDPDGSSGGGNVDVGIAIMGGTGNTIGGTTVAARNVISKNKEGMEINTSDNVVQGNYIGTDVTGTVSCGNWSDDGVEIRNGSTGNLIGGTAAGAGNLIAFNALDGVNIVDGSGHSVLGNRIYSNSQLGIDLNPDGVTANDANDADSGANNLQNFPVLTSATTNGSQITIVGLLNSTANSYFRIEFFSNSAQDPTGHGEGQRYLGFANVTTNGSGNATISTTLTATVAAGEFISATATKSDATFATFTDTSEFAESLVATSSTFQQGTGGYSGTEDTELSSTSPSSNLGANVTIDLDYDVANENQGLILFNNIFGTGAGQIPIGSTIVSASLRLYASGGTANTISAHRMLVSWTEASTWNSLTGGVQTNGAEAEVTADGTYVGTGSTGYITITGLEQSVQAWSSGASNFGWVLQNSGTDGLQFASSEAANVTQRPQLIVVYTPPNSAPTITNLGGDNLAYAEGAGAVVIDQGSAAVVADVDSSDFDTGTLTVSFTAGSDSAEDVLAIRNQGTDAGQIGVSGANVTYQGVTIGSFTGGSGGTSLVVTFNANSTPAAAQALVRNITYQNTDTGAPTTGARTLRFVLTDGDGGTSANQDVTVTVSGVNDAPVANNDPSFSTQVLANQPVGYWRLGESSGPTAVNLGSSGTNGTYSGPTLGAAGALSGDANTAADFDGLNDQVNVGTFDVAGTGLTLMGWFNAYDFGTSDQRIISKALSTGTNQEQDHLWMLSTYQNGSDYVLRFRVKAGGTTDTLIASSGALSPGQWYFASATYDAGSSQMKLFLNGVEVGSKTHSTGGAVSTDATKAVVIGANPNGYGFFDGRIDEVAVYDKAINQSQLQLLFAASSGAYAVNEDAVMNVSAAQGVLANDSDVEGDPLTAVLVSGPSHAASFTLNADGSFTYTPTANFNGTDSFTYRANDGTDDSNVATVSINVAAVNDAPVLDPNGFMALTTITEDATSNSGNLVAAIIASGGGDRITDADAGAVEGIAIQGLTSGNGTWQYNIGSGWTDIGTVSEANALLLRATDRVRFVPDGPNSDMGFITFNAWDQTSGMAGDKVDVSVTGGTTAFSAGLEVAAISVNAVNDAPVNTAPSGQYTAYNTSLVFSATNGNQISISDVDAGAGSVQLTLTVGHGTLTLGDTTGLTFTGGANGSASLTVTGSVTAINTALNGMTYAPTTNYRGVDTLQIVTNDLGRSGSGGAQSDTDTVKLYVGAVVVTNTDGGAANGNTTSISALAASDGGDGISLREAILAANNTAGTDYISFAIAGTGVHTITPTTALPTITGTVILDATTDDSFANNSNQPAIILDGNNGFSGDGLVLTSSADGSTIRGLVIRDFSGDGIEIRAGSDNNTIAGNYIGRLTASGTDAGAGEANNSFGLNILGSGNTIGGTTAADRNVISGNADNGIYVGGGANNVISGNYIGTTAAGNVALGNQSEGIEINGATNTRIGGTAPGEGNVVAASGQEGVWIINGATGTVVQGNWIGTDKTGTVNLGNASSGIRIGNTVGVAANNNLIGGTVAEAGNVIAFNTQAGVAVDTFTDPSVGNAILGNSIYANTGIGIDLDDLYSTPASDGVTANDAGDGDTGGNNRQNFPVLASAVTTGTQVTINGTLNSTANSYFRIEFFSNTAQDGTGYGEGKTYLGFVNVATDAGGNASFSAVLTTSVASGSFISATATRSNATFNTFTDTSEFAQNGAATAAPVVTTTGSSLAYTENATATAIDPGLTVSDADSTNLTGATVSISANYADGQDVLAFTNQLGITGSWNSTNGVLTLTGTATVANYQTALRSVTYVNTSGAPSTAARTVAFTVSDGTANSTAATRDISITAVNDAPMVNDQAFSVDENAGNGTVVGTVVASDPDAGDTLSYAITGGNTGGAFAINAGTGQITVNNSAALNFETNPTFSLTVEVTDSGTPGLTDTATVTINLNNLNETPVVNDQSFPVNENAANGTVVGTVAASDPDAGDTLTYAITGGNTGGAFAINASTGEITVNNSAALNFEMTPAFNLTVQVTDAGTPGLTDTATVTINLNNLNETPVVNDQSFPVNENAVNGMVVGTVAASDPDAGDTLTYAITGGNTGGAFAINAATGEITVNNSAALNFESNPTFNLTVQVTDSGTPGLTDTATVTINLNNLNETPVVNDQSFPVNENAANGTVVGTVAASDPDAGDTLSYAITGGNTGGAFAINASTGEITVNNSAALNFETNPTFNLTVQVTDAGTPGLSDTATVTINLNNLNETPVVNDQSFRSPRTPPTARWSER